MAIFHRSSLTWKLTRIVVCVALLFGIILNFIQIVLDFRSEEEKSAKIVSQIIESSLPAATDIAYKLDRSGAQEFIHGLLIYDFISEATLYEDAGNILAKEKAPTTNPTATRWLTKLLFSEFEERERNLYRGEYPYSYGTLHLTINNDIVYGELYARSLNVFASGIARNLLLSFVLLIIFYFLLTRPLSRIASFFSETEPESTTGKRLSTPSGHEQDEIGKIINRANSYLESSEKYFRENAETNLQLERSYRHMRKILETAAEGFIRTDETVVIQDTNPSMENILGRPAREICGRSLFDFVKEEEQQILELQINKRREGIQSKYNLTFITNDDRREVPCSVSATPLIDEAGQYVGGFGFITDISEVIQAEQDKEKLEAELFQARKMESIGTLAGGIAHDFNNILASIIGYSELALDYAGDKESVKEDVGHALTSALRGKELVKQILAFSRQSKKRSTHLSLAKIIKDVLVILEPSLPADIAVLCEIDDDSRTVFADAAQLEQVVINLCTNSFHAMEKNGGRLTIHLSSEPHPQKDRNGAESEGVRNYAHLMIQDTGDGIEESILDRVFDPFFTTKEVGKGTGMGLSIVHGIIKECDGWIEIQSKPGMGTTTHVYIPETDNEGNTESITATSNHGTETILLVDDEPGIRNSTQRNLRKYGYTIISCETPFEAFEQFRNKHQDIDLVITDYSMLGLNGIDLSRKILQIRRDIPILLQTGYNASISGEALREAGIRG
ncbi:MAG: PAS domain S-box protein, partial [Desulfobulbaceae bacterium]